jgi:hypothetical protein
LIDRAAKPNNSFQGVDGAGGSRTHTLGCPARDFKSPAAAIKLLRAKYPEYRRIKLDAQPVIEIAVKRVVKWEANEG